MITRDFAGCFSDGLGMDSPVWEQIDADIHPTDTYESAVEKVLKLRASGCVIATASAAVSNAAK